MTDFRDVGKAVAAEFLRGPETLVGRVLEGDYPAANYLGIPQRLERRRVEVERVRDTAAEPLDPITTAVNPQLRRGRLLVTGRDLDKRAERSFYLDSFSGLRIYDPGDDPADSGPIGELQPVVVIDSPEGWKPTDSRDIPPNVSVYHEPDSASADAFARAFNQEEMKDPCGRWAVRKSV